MCTNHHPENVIPQIMLRLQAKQEQRVVLQSVVKGESQVSHVAKELPQLPGTKVKASRGRTVGSSTSNALVPSLLRV